MFDIEALIEAKVKSALTLSGVHRLYRMAEIKYNRYSVCLTMAHHHEFIRWLQAR